MGGDQQKDYTIKADVLLEFYNEGWDGTSAAYHFSYDEQGLWETSAVLVRWVRACLPVGERAHQAGLRGARCLFSRRPACVRFCGPGSARSRPSSVRI